MQNSNEMGNALEERFSGEGGAFDNTGSASGALNVSGDGRKKQVGWKIATVILSLVVVVLGGILVLRMIDDGAIDLHPKDDSLLPDVVGWEQGLMDGVEQRTAVRDFVETMRTRVAGFLVTTLDNEFVGSYEVELDFYREYNEAFPIYQQHESMPYTPLGNSYGFGIFVPTFQSFFTEQRLMEILESEEYRQAVTNTFVANGFSQYAEGAEYINRETGVICNLPYGGIPVHFACSHVDWYNSASDELIKELSEAYGEVKNLIMSEPAVVDSAYSPYQTARVSLGTLMSGMRGMREGLFYRTGPMEKWQYFTIAQNALGCDEYDTEDLRRAFAGAACYDVQTGEKLVVKVSGVKE